jgi:hypothetical protein
MDIPLYCSLIHDVLMEVDSSEFLKYKFDYSSFVLAVLEKNKNELFSPLPSI